MEHTDREIARFDPGLPREAASTPPASWYREAEFFERERARVFQSNWICVGRADQVRENGNYFSVDIAGEPCLVVRSDDGQVRAFRNVCRHHAAIVASAEGCATEFECPYHGWTYDLKGKLCRVPGMGNIENFDIQSEGLPSIEAQVMGPLVFVSGSNSPRDLQADLGDLFRLLDSGDDEEYRFLLRRRHEVGCNWKVFVDNYLDGGYHVGHLHRDLASHLDLDGYETVLHDRYSIQSVSSLPDPSDSAGANPGTRVEGRALYAWAYPQLMINCYGPFMDVNVVLPRGRDRTEVIFDYFITDEGRNLGADFLEESLRASDQVQEEDRKICESVQAGLSSSAYDRGRYAGPEDAMHHFHTLLHQDLSGDLPGAQSPM